MLPAKKIKKGFTLIELLVVMAVLGTLATFVVFNYRNATERAEDSKRQTELQQYQNLLEVYASNNNNRYIDSSGTINIVSQCSTLNPSAPSSCPDDPDPDKNFQYNGTSFEYVLWTELDIQESGSTNYFVICSIGLSGHTTTEPSTSTCPL